MPIYEFACRACGREFEALVRRREEAVCPSCAATDLDPRMSVFAPGRGAGRAEAVPAPGACGTCGDPRGPGACARN